MSELFDVCKTARAVAQEIEAEGLTVDITDWSNSVGRSCYLHASVTDGRRFAKFGVRVSDHAVSSNRAIRDMDEIQHHINGEPTADQMQEIIDMARRARIHIKGN